MKTCLYSLIIALLTTMTAFAVWEDRDFDYYGIILEREPFGSVQEAEEPEPAPAQVQPHESFARHLRLSALWEIEGMGVRVGIIDTQRNQNHTLGVGDSFDGIELVSANFDEATAELRMGSEYARIDLQQNGAAAIDQTSSRRLSPRERLASNTYLERRRTRLETQSPAERREPRYTGEELQQRLQQVQMEAIRSGQPPLPIPLTPEMDRQLVEEGVLPPLEDESISE